MLNINFRNINITTDDHNDLLRDDVRDVVRTLKEIFDAAENSFKKNPPCELCYSVTRLNRTDKLIVAYNPEASKNPYLFLLDRGGKKLSKEIPLEKLLILNKEPVKYILNENIKNIADISFKSIQSNELTEQVKRMSKSRWYYLHK